MILVLTQNGAKLEFELALLRCAPGPHRDPPAFVEFAIRYLLNAALQIYDAFLEHAQPTKTRLDTLTSIR